LRTKLLLILIVKKFLLFIWNSCIL